MRYVFEDPPVWGDLLTVLSNIWLVFFALALTVQGQGPHRADLIYSWLPLKPLGIRHPAILVGSSSSALGLVMIIYGMEAVATMGGKYWEMWHFAWENGQIVFKPNYMPKKYAIAIVPISGFLVCLAAIASIIEDSLKMRDGSYRQAKDVNPPAGDDPE